VNETAVYLDNAAATRMDERVIEAMLPYMTEKYAVATSQFGYSLGLLSKEALDGARATLASYLGAEPEEFVFTSGSAESSNMAIKGVAMALAEKKGRHIISTAIEDFPVLHSARSLERQGFSVDHVRLDEYGRVDLEHLQELIRPDTILVTFRRPTRRSAPCRTWTPSPPSPANGSVLLHTDATHVWARAAGRAPDTVDLVTRLGPSDPRPQRDRRPVHPPGHAHFQVDGRRLSRVQPARRGREHPRRRGFRQGHRAGHAGGDPALARDARPADERLLAISHSRVNGHPEQRLPHNANISFRFVEGESVLLHLDMRGFAVSTGSACFSRSLEASHVILGIGGNHERAHGSVRFTFGRFNQERTWIAWPRPWPILSSRLRSHQPSREGVEHAITI
jgi:cysteine desulfurase